MVAVGAEPVQLRGQLYRYRWALICVFILALSIFAVQWIGASPAYDPYGWLAWGYNTLHRHLELNAAPSWKPLTFIFILPYSLFGHYAVKMWMVTETALAFGGPFVLGRIVHKVARDRYDSLWPARIAAVAAGICLMSLNEYSKYWMTAQADPMITTLFLLWVDCLLRGRLRWGLLFLWLVATGRPEAWPFLFLYVIWLGYTHRDRIHITLAVIALVSIPFLWYGVPVLVGDSWNVSSHIDQVSGHGIKHNAIRVTLGRFRDLSGWPIKIMAAIGILLALWKRDRQLILLIVISGFWLLVEIAFSLHGLSGAPRYMFEAAAVMIAVGCVALAWVLGELIVLAGRGRLGRLRIGPLPYAAALLVLAAVVVFSVSQVKTQWNSARAHRAHEVLHTAQLNQLSTTIRLLGGPKFIESCGDPTATVEWASTLAYLSHLNNQETGWDTRWLVTGQTTPAVLFTQWRHGWEVQTYNIPAQDKQRCARLEAAYYQTSPQYPDGHLYHGRRLPAGAVRKGP